MVSGNNFRSPAVAGSFYPADKKELLSTLKNFFSNTQRLSANRYMLKALIVPHAGYIYSGQTAAWGFAQLPKNRQDPHFILVGPSHHFAFSGLAGSSQKIWATPLGHLPQIPHIPLNDSAHKNEHCLEVQLPFLQFLYPKFSVSCLLTGQDIPELLEIPDAIYIISSDLSHYLPEKEARAKDQKTISAILDLNTDYFVRQDNVACGSVGIQKLLAMAKQNHWQAKLFCYDNSKTGNVVGYAAIGFYEI